MPLPFASRGIRVLRCACLSFGSFVTGACSAPPATPPSADSGLAPQMELPGDLVLDSRCVLERVCCREGRSAIDTSRALAELHTVRPSPAERERIHSHWGDWSLSVWEVRPRGSQRVDLCFFDVRSPDHVLLETALGGKPRFLGVALRIESPDAPEERTRCVDVQLLEFEIDRVRVLAPTSFHARFAFTSMEPSAGQWSTNRRCASLEEVWPVLGSWDCMGGGAVVMAVWSLGPGEYSGAVQVSSEVAETPVESWPRPVWFLSLGRMGRRR